MKLLSRKDINKKQSDELETAQKITQYVSTKSRELDDFKRETENKKQVILNDFVAYAAKIAGQKALLEKGFSTSEEQKGIALKSLSTLALDTEQKLTIIAEKEQKINERESNCQQREDKLLVDSKLLGHHEQVLLEKAERITSEGEKIRIDRENLEKVQLENAHQLADKVSFLDRRENILNQRETEFKEATIHIKNIAAVLEKDRQTFEKEKLETLAALDAKRKEDVKAIVEASYQERESALKIREEKADVAALIIRDREMQIKKDEDNIKAGYSTLGGKIKDHETRENALRDEYSIKEAKLASREASLNLKNKELDARDEAQNKRDAEFVARGAQLNSEVDAKTNKNIERARELNEVAQTLSSRWEKKDAELKTFEIALDTRKSDLDYRESTVKHTEEEATKTLELVKEDQRAWEKEKQLEISKLDERKKVADQFEKTLADKLIDINLSAETNKKNAELQTNREKEFEKHMADENALLKDRRETLERAFKRIENNGTSTT